LKFDEPRERLLDLTRLVSRSGLVLTGIDRVELAYLRALTTADVPVFGLVRTALGFLLLDRAGMVRLLTHFDGAVWPRVDLISKVNPKLSAAAKTGQSAARRLAVRGAMRRSLPAMLQRQFPRGVSYINVGHSNLSERVLSAVAQCGGKITVMIHDTIPLDYPQYQRSGSPERLAGIVQRVSRWADQVICVTEAEAKNVARHLEDAGRVPELHPIHIGVDVAVPSGLKREKPFFMAVGTVEPRKNHGILMDAWEALGPDAPELLICGKRGWANEALFARLDGGAPNVIELPDLSDADLAALYSQTSGLLFPSFAEGFGLPPVEAALAGAPIICSNLPSCREILGAFPVYLDPTDRYQWEKAVRAFVRERPKRGEQTINAPTWDAHFKSVFTII